MWSILSNLDAASETNISPDEVKQKIDKKESLLLLDVRTREEYHGPDGDLPGVVLKPSGELNRWIGEIEAVKDREIIVYCYSGARSGQVVHMLTSRNIVARNMNGGIMAWHRLRYPVLRNG
jgi:rhodanese-related sulfurtransferase